MGTDDPQAARPSAEAVSPARKSRRLTLDPSQQDPIDQLARHGKESDSAVVEVATSFNRCASGRRPGVGSLKDDAELVARQRPPPGPIVKGKAWSVGLPVCEFPPSRETWSTSGERTDAPRGSQQPSKVEAGVP